MSEKTCDLVQSVNFDFCLKKIKKIKKKQTHVNGWLILIDLQK